MNDIEWDFENNDVVVKNGDFVVVGGDKAIMQEIALRLKTPYYRGMLDFVFGSDLTGRVNEPKTRKVEVIKAVNEALARDSFVKDWDVAEVGDEFEVEVILKTGGKVNVRIS